MRVHKRVQLSEEPHAQEATIYGSNHWQMVHAEFDNESEEHIQYVNHYGKKYSLDEFVLTKRNPWGDAPEWMQEFDGYLSDSFFSGILIKLSDCGESAKVFTFIS